MRSCCLQALSLEDAAGLSLIKQAICQNATTPLLLLLQKLQGASNRFVFGKVVWVITKVSIATFFYLCIINHHLALLSID